MLATVRNIDTAKSSLLKFKKFVKVRAHVLAPNYQTIGKIRCCKGSVNILKSVSGYKMSNFEINPTVWLILIITLSI